MSVKRLVLIAALLVSIGACSAQATVRYVNRDSSCPGSGTTGSPYCSIQNAFNVAAAGDDIRIRKASSPYDENAIAQSSGTSGSPITVESDDATNQAVVRYTGNGAVAGAIQILDKNYWTIQNLIFDGTSVNTSTMAVWIGLNNTSRWTSGPDVTGFKVLNNTFKNWGGTEAQESAYPNQSALNALLISGGYGAPVGAFTISETLVQGNVFDGDRLIGLGMTSTKNSVVQNNEIKNITCGRQTSGGTGLAVVADGIHIIAGTFGFSTNDTYKNNTIHDFQPPGSCGLTITGDGYYEWAGLHTDVDPNNGTIDGNTVYNIDPSSTRAGVSLGLFIEFGSFGWTVKNNIVYNIGQYGIFNNQGAGTGSPNLYTNNTIYNIGHIGLDLRYGYATVENNIIDNAGSAQIVIDSAAVSVGHITSDYNDYWDSSGGSKVGSWNGGGVVNFSNWKTACSCDSHSINANPLFVNPPSDFHLQSSSPALTAGISGTYMGALRGAAALPNISSLTASPSSIYPTQSSMLSWNTSGATSLSIDQGIGTVTGTTSKAVAPSSTTTYTLTASNSNGSVTAKTTVAVAPPVISSFTANPATISAGQSSTLSWSVTGATSLSINQGVGTITGTSQAVSPGTTTTYTLTASNSAGSTTAQVTVTLGAASSSGRGILILE